MNKNTQMLQFIRKYEYNFDYDLEPSCEIDVLIGKTLVSIENINNQALIFKTTDDEEYHMVHEYNCCEDVTIDDICGNLKSLVGTPIIVAEKTTNKNNKIFKHENDESCTWTFYKFATINGWVDVRWYGTSNGYYSEGVSFMKVKSK